MKNKLQKIVSCTVIISAMISSLLITGCGKDEAAGGTVGAASGAMIGAAVSGRNSKGEGAVLGGLVGNYIGRSIGRSSDRKQEQTEHKKEIDRLKTQNQQLERQLTKWCVDCNRQVRIRAAQSCPDCGGNLIQEKFCERCKTIFSPDSGYSYCPYCNVRVALKGR